MSAVVENLKDHPMLPLLGAEELEAGLADPVVGPELAEMLNRRAERIALGEADPFRYGWELEHWRAADEQLRKWVELVLFIFGGNRSGKSEYAAKRIVQTAVEHGDSILMCLHESEASSIETQQKLIWKYLPPELKGLNDKRHPVYKIRYTVAGGFTERKVVLPNRSELHFVSYSQEPGAFEGWELGPGDGAIGLGAWADENMPLPWVKMLLFRLASRAAKLVWTFTPTEGMTPTIKDLVGTGAKTLESREAELLAGRVNVQGLPEGHMPFIQEPLLEKSRVIYFFSKWNPFGRHYEQIKKLCAGRESGFTEIRAYGYARDTVSRAFPGFTDVNIVAPEELPAVGTNYMFTDPAGARNWATLWVRVTPGKAPTLWIYRDWPDARRYGEWAVTASNPRKFDGEPGPAQIGFGHGIVQYKRVWLECETVGVGGKVERDPYRAGLAQRGASRAGSRPAAGDGYATREKIFERYIDRRAGKNQHAAEKGGTCLVEQFALEQRNERTGLVEGERMVFALASGVDINEGITQVNDLLAWNTQEPLCMGLNAPRLFVSSECKQVIWAMQNWTGADGEKGASKDFVDLVRYLALADLRHVTPGMFQVRGGGSY